MLQPQSTKKVEARASPSGSVSVSEHPSKTKLRAHALAIILKYETKTNVCGIMVLDQYFKTDNNVFENYKKSKSYKKLPVLNCVISRCIENCC